MIIHENTVPTDSTFFNLHVYYPIFHAVPMCAEKGDLRGRTADV